MAVTLSCSVRVLTRPTLERRKTLGHLRSINRNMIIHFANQSQMMSYRADKLLIDARTDTHTHTHTDAGNDNTWRPKLASGKNDWETEMDIIDDWNLARSEFKMSFRGMSYTEAASSKLSYVLVSHVYSALYFVSQVHWAMYFCISITMYL